MTTMTTTTATATATAATTTTTIIIIIIIITLPSARTESDQNTEFPATHDFVPVAIESLAPVNRTGREFLTKLDPWETAHLFQRLSICSQRFNAIAFRGTFAQPAVALDR